MRKGKKKERKKEKKRRRKKKEEKKRSVSKSNFDVVFLFSESEAAGGFKQLIDSCTPRNPRQLSHSYGKMTSI